MYIYKPLNLSLSVSLSLYIYIYIYMCSLICHSVHHMIIAFSIKMKSASRAQDGALLPPATVDCRRCGLHARAQPGVIFERSEVICDYFVITVGSPTDTATVTLAGCIRRLWVITSEPVLGSL